MKIEVIVKMPNLGGGAGQDGWGRAGVDMNKELKLM